MTIAELTEATALLARYLRLKKLAEHAPVGELALIRIRLLALRIELED